MKLYELATSKGHPKAAYNLGVFYARGLGGLEKSHPMARKYFHQAAAMGQQDAINALGLHAFKEKPTPVDDYKQLKPNANNRAMQIRQEIAVT